MVKGSIAAFGDGFDRDIGFDGEECLAGLEVLAGEDGGDGIFIGYLDDADAAQFFTDDMAEDVAGIGVEHHLGLGPDQVFGADFNASVLAAIDDYLVVDDGGDLGLEVLVGDSVSDGTNGLV